MSVAHATMNDVDTTTPSLALHPFTVEDAERLLSGEVDPHDGWAGGYSFTDEPELLREFVRAVRMSGDPAPFGPYLVRLPDEGAAIGGVNLFGPLSDDGEIEFAFGLVPAARGRGLAEIVVGEALALVRANGGLVATAEAEIANLPARRVLERVGMGERSRTSESITYAIRF